MAMEFRFEANQEFQLRAIEAVTALLRGQPRIAADGGFALQAGFAAVCNRLDLDDAALLANVHEVQARNGIAPDDGLRLIEEPIESASGTWHARFGNFSVEMETGTGKTYVYIRTALDLFRLYGLRKFIIVVPSVAIREGVKKTLDVTAKHLHELYANLPYRYCLYRSESLAEVRQFALSDSVELLVMTIDSFNKATNVIRQVTDRLPGGEPPLRLLQATRPVLILDEPQNMESELRVRALASLDPLLALRYSATHRDPYNLVHRLTPFDAYRRGLVKRIEVASVVRPEDANQVFLRLDRIDAVKHTVTARLALHKLMKNGTVKETLVTVRPGDSLEEKSGRPEYRAFRVDEINRAAGFVRFSNQVELRLGDARGADRDAIFETQIRYAIEEHFRKQDRLRPRGIKVLTLFFIDRVASYADDDGIVRVIFDRLFDELKAGRSDWKDKPAATVRAAYFAEKRRKGGAVEFVESVSGKTREDEAAYDLIMRDKERLLSFEEPVAFIFSHSALSWGWDNPNVFQICTLRQTASEMRKRQEVGRGVRLAVDQTGARIPEEQINVLTVVASESYERYVAGLQSEIAAEFGAEGVPPPPPDARRRRKSVLRKEYVLRPEFRELWERIKHKTRYSVEIDSAKVVAEVAAALDRDDIRPPEVRVAKAEVVVGEEDELEARQVAAERAVKELPVTRATTGNLLDTLEHLMEHTTPAMRVARASLLEVVRRTSGRGVAANPHEFAATAVRILKDRLAHHLVEGIKYEKNGEWYDMKLLQAEIESWEEYLVPAELSIYDHVPCESKVERDFVAGLEARPDVKLYVKLPGWFRVPTPVGEYNPDWAIVMEERDEHGKPTGKELLYLVRETKDATRMSELPVEERRKVECGRRHFAGALGVDFKLVKSTSELP